MGRLITVGRKLAILGCVRADPLCRWHIVRPGTFKAPQTQGNETYSHGTSLCGRDVETNGYPADFDPKDLCEACRERL